MDKYWATYIGLSCRVDIPIYCKSTTKKNNLSNVFGKCRIQLDSLYQKDKYSKQYYKQA